MEKIAITYGDRVPLREVGAFAATTKKALEKRGFFRWFRWFKADAKQSREGTGAGFFFRIPRQAIPSDAGVPFFLQRAEPLDQSGGIWLCAGRGGCGETLNKTLGPEVRERGLSGAIGNGENALFRGTTERIFVFVRAVAFLRHPEYLHSRVHSDFLLPQVAGASTDVEEPDQFHQVRVERKTTCVITEDDVFVTGQIAHRSRKHAGHLEERPGELVRQIVV